MKINPIRNLIARSKLCRGETINVLVAHAHSPYELQLAKSIPDAVFYAYNFQGSIPDWNPVREKPYGRYHILARDAGPASLPDVDYHLCITHNVGAHHANLHPLAKALGIPNIACYHTQQPYNAHQQQLAQYKELDYDAKVFITDYSRACWGFTDDPDAVTIYHGIDLDVFKPLDIPKQNYILTIGNEAIERAFELGFDIDRQATQGLPYKHLGSDNKNPQLHNPTTSIKQLVKEINTARIFLNTSRHSPFPLSLAESFACGAAIVTSNACAIPDIVQHKENCLVYPCERPDIAREHLEFLMNNPSECERLGRNARKLAEEFFSPRRFSEQWNDLIWRTITKV